MQHFSTVFHFTLISLDNFAPELAAPILYSSGIVDRVVVLLTLGTPAGSEGFISLKWVYRRGWILHVSILIQPQYIMSFHDCSHTYFLSYNQADSAEVSPFYESRSWGMLPNHSTISVKWDYFWESVT